MTKYLVKIISICSFIVLIPVIIAGVALCAVGSSMYKLSAYVAGADSQNASYTLFMGEKDKEKEEISEGLYQKGTEVVVSIKTLGYDFVGWFKGDDKTFNQEESNKLDFVENEGMYSTTVDLSANAQVTALLQVKKYTVKYTGFYDDPNIALEEKTETPEYGEQLWIPQKKLSNNVHFVGWQVANGDSQTFNKAEFATSGEIELVAVWSDMARVEYYASHEEGERPFLTQYVTAEQLAVYSMLDQNDVKVIEAVGKGYNFVAWEDMNLREVKDADMQEHANNFDAEAVYKIYVRKELIKYNLAVEDANLLYDAEQGFRFEGEEPKRAYYFIGGLKVNDKVYNKTEDGKEFATPAGEKLSDLVMQADTELSATIVWVCEYKQLGFSYSAMTENRYYVYTESGDVLISEEGRDLGTLKFADDEEGSYRVEDALLNAFIKQEGPYYVYNDADERVEAQLKEIWLYYHGEQPTRLTQSNVTFATILNILTSQEVDYDMTKDIEIAFIFEAK